MGRCRYEDGATGARCTATAVLGSLCEAHWESERVVYLANLERLISDLKDKISDPTLTPALRQAYWAQLRDARRARRMLTDNE